MSSTDADPGIMHFVERWLEPSARFVYSQLGYSRRRGVVVSALRPCNLERFPADVLVSLAWTEHLPGSWARRARTARLMALVSRHGLGLVHCHFGYRFSQVRGMVGRRHLPWVLSLHGQDVVHLVQRSTALQRSALAAVDAVIVPSRFLAGLALEAGARPERIHVIPSGVDTEYFSPHPLTDGPPEIVFVGRFVEKKGLDVLVDAWPAVRRAVPDARLRLLGYGPLEDLARSVGAGSEVIVDPDRDVVRDGIAAARVVVTPSRTAADGDVESLLLVNLEAQASGRPVVTTDNGGIPEYVRSGETGIIVPENDRDALAAGLVRVLRDDSLAERLGRAGVEWARRFDVRTCTGHVDDLYDSLASDRSGA